MSPYYFCLKGVMMLESEFQSNLIKKIESRFPGTVVLKNDPNYIQGFPDLTLLLPNGRWYILECKKSVLAPHRPNQDYYINFLNGNGLANFIYPENEEDVLNDIQQALEY